MRFTDKDEKALNEIRNYILKHGYAPSYRELGSILGTTSSSTTHMRIHRLIDMGLIETDTDDNAPRAIRIKGTKINIPKIKDIVPKHLYY